MIKKKKLNFTESKILFLIIIFGLILRTIFFVGLNWSDDPGYVFMANQILEGKFRPTHLPAMRLMVIYPLAVSFAIFGINDFSLVLYPVLCSVGSIILAFLIGKLLFDKKTGLLASFIVSVFPIDIIYSSWIMPDVPITFFTGLASLLFLMGRGEEGRRGIIYLIFSGICVGFSYLSKLSGLLVLIFFGSMTLYDTIKDRKIKFRYSWILLGFLIILLIESGIHYYYNHDPLFQFKGRFGYFSQEEKLTYEFNTKFDFYPKNLLNLNHEYKFLHKNKETFFGIFYYIVIASIIFTFYRKDNSIIPIIWLISIFLYMQFGTMSITSYVPMHRLIRHLTILTLPSILIVSNSFFKFSTNKIKLILSSMILIILVLSFLFYTYNIHYIQRNASKDIRMTGNFLKRLEPKTVYSDYWANDHLWYYLKFDKEWEFEHINNFDCEDTHDVYVVVNATRGWIEVRNFYSNFPYCVKNKPSNWVKLVTIESNTPFYPYNAYNPEIYLVK